MKNLQENLAVIVDTLNTQRITINDYPDMHCPHYFIDAKITICSKDYFVTTGFWDTGFDCRVEIDEMHEGVMTRCNGIEFDHSQDLKETLTQAIDECIAYKA